MRHQIFTLLFLLSSLNIYSQISMPEDFYYPEEAIENRVQGKVYIQFATMPSGDIIDSTVQVMQGLGFGLDEVAIQAVKEAPPLGRNSVTQLKKHKPTKYVLPIIFTIQPKDWANYYFRNGLNEFEKRQYQEAINFYKQAISFNAKAEYYFEIYNSYRQLDNLDEACAYLKKARKLNKKYKEGWTNNCK